MPTGLQAKDVAMAGLGTLLSQVPVVSAAAEFLGRVEQAEAANRVDGNITELQGSMKEVVAALYDRQLDTQDVDDRMDLFEALQRRQNALTFGGLIRFSPLYDSILRNPQRFGEVLTMDSTEVHDPQFVYMMIGVETGQPFVLKMRLFQFFQLLRSNMSRTTVDHQMEGRAIARAHEPLSLEKLQAQSVVLICTEQTKQTAAVLALIEDLDKMDMHHFFANELVKPGEQEGDSYDVLIDDMMEKKITPVLFFAEEVQRSVQWRIARALLDDFRSTVIPVYPAGTELDRGMPQESKDVPYSLRSLVGMTTTQVLNAERRSRLIANLRVRQGLDKPQIPPIGKSPFS